MATLLMIDNHDSFTYNLVQMFRLHPVRVEVRRSDRIDLEGFARLNPDYLVVGPGPGDPSRAGISMALIERFGTSVPTLGVCLGLQCLNEVFGGRTVRTAPVHGKVTAVMHEEGGVFAGVPSPMRVARYHSLACEPSDRLEVTARTADGVVMGLSHPSASLHGVQFHPESFMTEHGHRIVTNYLELGPLGRDLAVMGGRHGCSG